MRFGSQGVESGIEPALSGRRFRATLCECDARAGDSTGLAPSTSWASVSGGLITRRVLATR